MLWNFNFNWIESSFQPDRQRAWHFYTWEYKPELIIDIGVSFYHKFFVLGDTNIYISGTPKLGYLYVFQIKYSALPPKPGGYLNFISPYHDEKSTVSLASSAYSDSPHSYEDYDKQRKQINAVGYSIQYLVYLCHRSLLYQGRKIYHFFGILDSYLIYPL